MIQKPALFVSEMTMMPARLNWLAFPVGLLLVSLVVAADQPAVPETKRVTLPTDKVQLSKALASLTRQSGIRVEDRRGGDDPELKLDVQDAPFWQALDRIAEAGNARVSISSRDGRIGLVKRTGGGAGQISYSGPFRIALKRIATARDFEGNTQTTATLEVCWEPALQPFLLETRPQDLVVKDEANKTLPVEAPGSSVAPVDGRIALQFEVALPSVPRKDQRLGLIEGKLSAIGPSKMLQFTFDTLDQLDKAPAGGPVRKKTQEGISCHLSKLTLAPDRWTIQVTLDAPTGARLESFQSWVVNNEMLLVDPNGKRQPLSSSDYVLESASDRRAVISYNFRDKGRQVRGKPEDWGVSYTTPASVIVRPISFRFKDVELP